MKDWFVGLWKIIKAPFTKVGPVVSKIYKAPKLVGDFGDGWDATNKSANGKVFSVLSELDPDFIYSTGENALKLRLSLWTSELVGDPITLNNTLQWFELVDTKAPDGGDWTLDKVNLMQPSVLIESAQSFITFPQPDPIVPFNITKAGMEVAARYVDGNIEVHWLRKLFYYA